MIFIIFIGVLFLGVVFFHYVQGFFSSTISAILAVVAAVLAFSWHETIVEKLLGGKVANTAHAMVLVALFAGIYILLRIIFDKAVPEGITLPAVLDRIGGALMGIVAATFSVGIFAIAAQELPFGPAVAGYTKYESADNDAQVLGANGGQRQTGYNFDELHSDVAGRFDEADRRQLFPIILGVDEIVVDTVSHLSGTGSLQGSQPLTDVHPDFLQELFGQRIGIQGGAQHVTMNSSNPGAEKSISIAGVFTLPRFVAEGSPPAEARLVDGMVPGVRLRPVTTTPQLKIVKDFNVVTQRVGVNVATEKVQYVIPASEKQMLIVVRITFGIDAADKRDFVRISPGSIRLVRSRDGNPDAPEPRDYYPIGMLEPGTPYPLLYADKPDDYLLVPMIATNDSRPGVDAVFVVDKDMFLTPSNHKRIEDGVFIEIKRMFREELGGKDVKPWTAAGPKIRIGTLHQVRIHGVVVGTEGTYAPDPAKPAAP